MSAKPTKADVIPLFGRPKLEDEPIIRAKVAPISARPRTDVVSVNALDLTSKPRAWFLIGAGGTGKTLVARYLGWRMAEAQRTAIIAALDPQNRSLATWFSGVQQPETSDGSDTARWLRQLLSYVMDEKASLLADFGGGDTALAKLLDLAPDFADRMAAAGVEPIAAHCIGPRPDDLATLDYMEDAGFKPRATVLIMNEGRVDTSLTREEAFARVLRDPAFQAAFKRGAVPIWFPRLEPEVATEIEGKRLTFGQARDGLVPDGATFSPIGGLERSMVIRWLDQCDTAFKGIQSWLL